MMPKLSISLLTACLLTLTVTARAQNYSDYTKPFDSDGTNTAFLYHMEGPEAGASLVPNSGPSQWNAWATNVLLDTGSNRDATDVPSPDFITSIYFDGGDGTADDWPRVDTSVTMQYTLDTFENYKDAITLEAWIKPDRVTGTQRIISRTHSYFLYLVDDEVEVWFDVEDKDDLTTDALALRSVDAQIPVGQWTHIAGVWEKPNLSIWVNGQPQTVALRSAAGPIRKPRIGNWLDIASAPWPTENFKGYIDEVRVSSVARYHATTPTPTPNAARGWTIFE